LTAAESDLASPKIFIVGNSRSGTTMMGRILGNHALVFTLGELHFFEQLWSPADGESYRSEAEAVQLMAHLLSIQRQGYLSRGNPERFLKEASEIVSSTQTRIVNPAGVFEEFLLYEAEKNGKMIPCDQTPRNVFYIEEILELYPEARIINMIRDPRDVLLSQKRKWKRRFLGAKGIPLREALRSWVNYHPITISKLWNASIHAAARFTDERVYSLRFEDLLVDPEAATREICEFIGISFDRALLKVPQIGSSSGLDRPEQRGIDYTKAGSWRRGGGLNSTEVFLCQKVTGTWIEQYGYSPVPVVPNPLRLGLSMASFPIKLSLALLLNLKRMRNIKETVKRRLQ
jgi:hypothetical protein